MNQIKSPKIVLIIVLLILVALTARFGFTIASIEEEQAAVQNEAFDPAAWVDGQWDKIGKTYADSSQPLKDILSAMEPDANGSAVKDDLVPVAKKFGLITVGEAHVYMVEGTGTVTSVKADTSTGIAEVTLDGYDGPIKVLLFVGTRIPSDESSIRDAVGFISFGDFKEQTEYGKVSGQINAKILNTTLKDLDREGLVGKTVSFKGAFTIRTQNLIQIPLKEIKVVPFEFTIEG